MANILLIEPNVILARTYKQALQHFGHHVVHTVGAQEAIHAADKLMPDIVLMELQLAEHNGIEFLHEFRSYNEWRKIPVVINTYLSPSILASVQRALQTDLGIDVCLYKPQTSLQQLTRVIDQKILP